jgi:predicted nucleic acid-binding protein
VSTADPALVDTDVASVLYRARLFRADFGLIELGQTVAAEYGRLRAATEALGRPVPSNDLWIAASATANGLPLVTLNRRHFEPLTLHGLRLL